MSSPETQVVPFTQYILERVGLGLCQLVVSLRMYVCLQTRDLFGGLGFPLPGLLRSPSSPDHGAFLQSTLASLSSITDICIMGGGSGKARASHIVVSLYDPYRHSMNTTMIHDTIRSRTAKQQENTAPS